MSFIAKKLSAHKLVAALMLAGLLLTGVVSAATVNTPMTEDLDANDFNIDDANDISADYISAISIYGNSVSAGGNLCASGLMTLGSGGAVLLMPSSGSGPYPVADDGDDVLTATGSDGNMQTSAYASSGKGSDIYLTCGDGGLVGNTCNTCGAGGDIELSAGDGGSPNGSYDSVICGDGGHVSISSGTGGSGAGTLNYGGDGGDIDLVTGAGGTGTSSNGSYGNVLLAKNGGNVGIGTSSPSAELDVVGTILMDTLILPVKSTTGDPGSPVEGQIYVNTFDNKVRVYADSAWRDLVTW